jgi:hypothetical protein
MNFANRGEDGVVNTANSVSLRGVPPHDASVPWLETQAEVIACRYEFARMNILFLGTVTYSNKFIISFSYYAHAKTFSDEFISPIAIAKGKRFPVFYNPLNPQQNSRSEGASTSRVPVFIFGIAGSIVISLLYLGLIGGCN